MKKLIFILGFLFLSMFSFGQGKAPVLTDTIPMTLPPVEFDVRIKSDPMSVIISSEDLEKNQSLQKTLEVITYQNSVFNEHLGKLVDNVENKTVSRIQLLRKYDVNVLQLATLNRSKDIVIYMTLSLLFLLFYIRNFNIRSNIYNESSLLFKRGVANMLLIVAFTIFFIKGMYAIGSYDKYLFDILTKLF